MRSGFAVGQTVVTRRPVRGTIWGYDLPAGVSGTVTHRRLWLVRVTFHVGASRLPAWVPRSALRPAS